MGVAGVGLAVISTGVMLIGGDGKPDLDGIDLGGATARFDLAPTFGTRGAMASMHLRF